MTASIPYGPSDTCDVCQSFDVITWMKGEYSGNRVKKMCYKCVKKADDVLFRLRDDHIAAVQEWIQSGLSEDHHPDLPRSQSRKPWAWRMVIAFVAGLLAGIST